MFLPRICTILLNMAKKYYKRPNQPTESPIEQTLMDAEKLLDIIITVHDLTGIFHDDRGLSLLGPHRQSHRRSVLCGMGFGGRKCEQHCRREMNAEAGKHPGGLVHHCWKGLVEAVAPIHREGVHLATIFAGQWRATEAKPEEAHGRFPKKWQEAYARASVWDSSREGPLLHVLSALGQGLLAHVEHHFDLDRPPENRKTQVLRFLKYHATTRIRLEDLAAALHLSPSRTSHLVREELGMSFQELVKEERIRRACSLLRSTDLPIRQIGQRVGIDNEYYFNRLFRKTTGQTPGTYRKG